MAAHRGLSVCAQPFFAFLRLIILRHRLIRGLGAGNSLTFRQVEACLEHQMRDKQKSDPKFNAALTLSCTEVLDFRPVLYDYHPNGHGGT